MSKKSTNNYYVVWVGRKPGVYASWTECEAQVKGAEGAKFKGFSTREEAEKAFQSDFTDYIKKPQRTAKPKSQTRSWLGVQLPALAVDAACSGNPGVMEFRGVVADTGSLVFHRGPFVGGTNNIGEFLAIVLGLAYLKKENLPWVLYSDSKTAQAWVREKRCKSKLTMTPENAPLFEMIRRAENWLQTNTYSTQIIKWKTEEWGEIPADFGRK